MSNKQKKAKLQQKRAALRAKREQKRLKKLADEGRTAIAADLSRQVPNNSYDPPEFYVDRPFTCVDCGAEEVWTAEQQKWYYEVAKGSIYATAVRCRPCRQKWKAEKGTATPNPVKRPEVMLAAIRDAIEPSLAAAGFQFDGRNKPQVPVYLYIDYSRGDDLFRLAWDQRGSGSFLGFTAELLREPDEYVLIEETGLADIARLPRRRVADEIQNRMDSFAEKVKQFLDSLAVASSGGEDSDD